MSLPHWEVSLDKFLPLLIHFPIGHTEDVNVTCASGKAFPIAGSEKPGNRVMDVGVQRCVHTGRFCQSSKELGG